MDNTNPSYGNLTPTLSYQDLNENIQSLQNQGMQQPAIQNYINNYQKAADGSYTLKNAQTAQQPQTPQQPANNPISLAGNIVGDTVKNIGSSIWNLPGNIEKTLSSPGQGMAAQGQPGATGFNIGDKELGVAGDVANTILSPFTGLQKAVTDNISKSIAQSISQNPDVANSPAVSKLSDLVQSSSGQIQNLVQKNPEAASNLANAVSVIFATLAAPEMIKGGSAIANGVTDAATKVVGGGIQSAEEGVRAAKEAISPSLTPEEQTGKIIQGKLRDIPAAQRTFDALPSDTGDITKISPKDLSSNIEENIIQKNLNEISALHANDTTPHPISDFERVIGSEASEVKTNPVQDAIDQLKEQYTKVNNTQGLSDIKALEEKANTEGLTSGELNDLAKEHGTAIKAFNANGEAASGLSKQAAENTRSGVKATAREMLAKNDPEAAVKAESLDKETSDAIKTKKLLDKQVENENTKIQKKGKPNAITKFTKEHPIATKVIKGAAALTGLDVAKHVLP